LSDAQVKLLEVIAAGALNIAAIFFTVLTVLFAGILTTWALAQIRPLYYGTVAAYGFVVISLILTGLALIALRFRTPNLYLAAASATVLTMMGMLGVASYLLHRSRGIYREQQR
jgi:hypothetical protein